MKKKLFSVILFSFLVLAVTTKAQETNFAKNEIRLGYGVLTQPELANALFSIWPQIGIEIYKDSITDYHCSFYGVPSLEYNYRFKPWISFGAGLSINPISTVIKTKKGIDLTWNYYLINVMPRVDFYYVNKGLFSMYSGLQAGASIILWQDRQGSDRYTDSGIVFAYHVNAFGIRIGKEIGAYMEWGFGYRGIVNFGISGKF